ncbi:uncharacterized protein LOC126750376 isoform X2 [Anthonomus grandis grandis]|uniref:uncharacterized protein LOC126750376 isoform X2 n=1 Tax=Anthonomus grandis grandis TaxID=2921223 RepID=UPI0021658A05|nr:uncharacterized protein LOC126750376 isoform X2 [Anthonomus grandis grandis]
MSIKPCLKTGHYLQNFQQFSTQFSDKDNCFNYLKTVFQQDPKTISPLQLEEVLHSVHLCFSTLGSIKSINNYLKNHKNIELYSNIITDNGNRIPVSKKWFGKFLLVASMQFHPNICSEQILLNEAMLLFNMEKYESKFLLHLILKLCDCKLDSKIALQVFYFVQMAALTPHTSMKSVIENISKKVLPYIDKKLKINLECLPLRGVPTSQLSRFRNAWNEIEIVTRIIEMFSNNIHNREAGFLYQLLLNMMEQESFWSFVWPHFSYKLGHIDHEGEFFQSLLKYWIPISVATFGSSFYHRTLTTNIPNVFKGYILLETRKQRRYSTVPSTDFKKNDMELLRNLIYEEETYKLGFHALCWYNFFYKEKVPCKEQLELVFFFFERQTSCLGPKDLKIFEELLQHICDIILKDIDDHKILGRFLLNMFSYGQHLLRTKRKDLGAQIITISKFQRSEEIYQKFNSKCFLKLVDDIWKDGHNSYISYPVCHLAVKVLSNVANNDLLLKSVETFGEVFSIKATESIGNYAQCIIESTSKENVSELNHRTFTELKTLFREQKLNLKAIFKANLLFQILTQSVEICSYEEWVRNECFFTIAPLLHQKFYHPIDPDSNTAENCMEKVIESLYDNICSCLLNKKDYKAGDNFTKIMLKLVEIIEISNMRKPTMLSELLLKHYASFYDKIYCKQDKEEFLNFKIGLLKGIFQNLEAAGTVQNLTIRRHPETRLVIHALCASGASDQKVLLTLTLNQLLSILSNPASTDATVASTLHSTEILISDNRLYDLTLTYIPAVISCCIKHFGNRNWTVRNGCIQLLKALIIRFLGVPIGPNDRPRSTIDLFNIFPVVVKDFYQALTVVPLNDSALAVLQFFSESQIKVEMFSTELKLFTMESFLRLFVRIISEDSGYGLYAARAYVSLCAPQDISSILTHIVDFFIAGYLLIRQRHVIRNFILLLQELLDKYNYSIRDKLSGKPGYGEIHRKLNELSCFLKIVNCGQFDLLLVRTLSVEEILHKFENSSSDLKCFPGTVWLHNNVPFLITNVPIGGLKRVLNVVLSKNIPEFVQIKVLGKLLDRISHSCDDFSFILEELILKALNTSLKASTYLQMSYYKLILLIFNRSQSATNFLPNISNFEDSNLQNLNIYTLLVIILTLNNFKDNSKHLNVILKRFESEMTRGTEDAIESISEILKYVHQSASCICQKRKILKLALFIVVEHGHWHLLNHLTNCFITTPNVAVQQLINFKFLVKYFQNPADAFQFVQEFCEVKRKDSVKVCNKGYYVVEEEEFVDKALVDRLVFRFLKDFCEATDRSKVFLEICSQFDNKRL